MPTDSTSPSTATPEAIGQGSQPLDRFAELGYADGGPLLDADTVAELRDELDRVIAERERDDRPQPLRVAPLGGDPARPVWQIVNIWQASDAFARLVHHPDLIATAEELLGGPVRLWHDQIQYKPPGIGGENSWHQDRPYWGALTGMEQVTAWIALDAVDVDNGCMSMVPQSHRWGVAIDTLHAVPAFDQLPPRFAGHEVTVSLRPVACGHVHWHHSLTWHGSHANASDRPRRAIALHYMPASECFSGKEHLACQGLELPVGQTFPDERFPPLGR